MWGKLLDDLAVDAQMTERERKSMEELTFLDRARIIEKRLGGSAQLTQAIARRLEGKYYALAHAFIQALPGKGTPSFLPSPPPPKQVNQWKIIMIEAITMNYDTLFEAATRGAGMLRLAG